MDDFINWQKWPPCMGYNLCKMVSLGQTLKLPKYAKNDSRTALELFYARNGSKKQLRLYLSNKTILKSAKKGHYEKATDFEKWSVRERLFKLFLLPELVCG